MDRRNFNKLIFYSALSTFLFTAPPAAFATKGKASYRYICGCAMATGCQLSYDHPGTCPCGKPLFEKKIIREDEKYYYISRCTEPNSKCTQSPGDENKCTCGKELFALEKKPTTAYNCFKDGCKLNKDGVDHEH